MKLELVVRAEEGIVSWNGRTGPLLFDFFAASFGMMIFSTCSFAH
jgi:hypothetical protein